MTIVSEDWDTWKEQRTKAFRYLIDYLFDSWNLNKANEFRGFKPKDLIFREYYCAKGVTGYWMNKEVYSFSLNSYLWFNGRVYYENCEYCSDELDLIEKNTIKISSNGIYLIFEDRTVCDNVLLLV
jgi:hypothetical protein